MSRRKGQSPHTVACRKCTAFIPAAARFCPNCGATQKTEAVPSILVILLLCTSLLLMTSTYVTSKQVDLLRNSSKIQANPGQSTAIQPLPPKDPIQGAYVAAKGFIEKQFPNAQRISSVNESPVRKNGDIYQVTLFVDSNEGGAPTRNVLQVNLQLDGANWKLKDIAQ